MIGTRKHPRLAEILLGDHKIMTSFFPSRVIPNATRNNA
jgi:hypothetical protein